jgi:hypothetical protein
MEINGIDINDIEPKITEKSICIYCKIKPNMDENATNLDYVKATIDRINAILYNRKRHWYIVPETIPQGFYDYQVRRIEIWERLLKENGYKNYQDIAKVFVLDTVLLDIICILYPDMDMDNIPISDFYDNAIIALIEDVYDDNVCLELFYRDKCDEWDFYNFMMDKTYDVDNEAELNNNWNDNWDEIYEQNIKDYNEKIKNYCISGYLEHYRKKSPDYGDLEKLLPYVEAEINAYYEKRFDDRPYEVTDDELAKWLKDTEEGICEAILQKILYGDWEDLVVYEHFADSVDVDWENIVFSDCF